MWHMQYAWLPLSLLLFDISLEPGRRRWAIYSGIVLALIVYMGGIYPLPHTALLLVFYGCVIAAARRTIRPLVSLAIVSVCGICFAAPKLLPMIDLMMRYPRKVASTEAIDLSQLTVMLTEPNQSYDWAPIAVPQWGWHEYGIYVGYWVVVSMIVGFVAARGSKALALKASGLLFLLLGFGAFHPRAPWTLLHALPVFNSQHVPTRFLFPAILLLTATFASFAGRIIDDMLVRRPWLDVLLLVPVYLIAIDIAAVGRKTMEHAFYLTAPEILPRPTFHHQDATPYLYAPGEWSGATLLAMYANVGVVGCYGVPDTLVRGAISDKSPGYRGEAYVVSGSPGKGGATVTHWTPNTATVQYSDAPPQSLVVYNMNFDPSWTANGTPAVDYQAEVAFPVPPGSGVVHFRYYPRTFNWGLLLFGLAAGVTFVVPAIRHWTRRRAATRIVPQG
jgi:hypothetical protein